MATLTVRNVPDGVVQRLRETALNNGWSMEQEIRDLLTRRYARRRDLISRVRARWSSLPRTTGEQAKRWRSTGRKAAVR